MDYYNTSFKVKYYDCEKELIEKINFQTDLEYDKNDVHIICDKLYQDEFCSVFYAENILDDRIDNGLQNLLVAMKENDDFLNVLQSIKQTMFLCFEFIDGTEEDKINFETNSDYIIFASMFSFPIFYIMHHCVCQQLTNKNIEINLLNELLDKTIKFINRQN
jgi:hypothetical protein